MIYIELGWFPIEIAIKVKMMSYWVRLLTGKETKIKRTIRNGQSRETGNIIDYTDYSYIWFQQIFQNSDLLLALTRNRLHEQFIQGWHSLIQNSPKAINNRLLKDNFVFEIISIF